MRYEIDQKLFVINFAYTGNYAHGMYSVPLKYNDIQPESINFVELKVTEHHRVPGDYDSELNYDGYLLKDDKGNDYANQYPRASYGQISDTANRRFHRHIETLDQLEKGSPYEYNLLADTLSSIYEGIDLLDQPGNTYAIEKRDQLIVLRDRIFEEFALKYPQIELTMGKEKLAEFSKIMHWTANFYSKPV